MLKKLTFTLQIKVKTDTSVDVNLKVKKIEKALTLQDYFVNPTMMISNQDLYLCYS